MPQPSQRQYHLADKERTEREEAVGVSEEEIGEPSVAWRLIEKKFSLTDIFNEVLQFKLNKHREC